VQRFFYLRGERGDRGQNQRDSLKSTSRRKRFGRNSGNAPATCPVIDEVLNFGHDDPEQGKND
jgi:hypothetical protein